MMENPKKKKSTMFQVLGNKYVWVLLFFIIWMLFLDNYSYFDHRFLNKQIDELETNKEYYLQEINKDEKNIQLLNNSNQIEKYAREKYYMKKDSEDVYIIEFEDQLIKDSLLNAQK